MVVRHALHYPLAEVAEGFGLNDNGIVSECSEGARQLVLPSSPEVKGRPQHYDRSGMQGGLKALSLTPTEADLKLNFGSFEVQFHEYRLADLCKIRSGYGGTIQAVVERQFLGYEENDFRLQAPGQVDRGVEGGEGSFDAGIDYEDSRAAAVLFACCGGYTDIQVRSKSAFLIDHGLSGEQNSWCL